MSFDISPGEVIGLVGRSGSGKSTVARLIQRLYPPEHGRVLVDGLDVALIDPETKKPTRVGFRTETVTKDGVEKTVRVRYAKKSGKDL